MAASCLNWNSRNLLSTGRKSMLAAKIRAPGVCLGLCCFVDVD
jgi:hypothetical protein